MNLNKIVALSLLSLALGGCAMSDNESKNLSGEWKVTAVDGQKISALSIENEAYLGFELDKMRFYGSTGCNRVMGNIDTSSGLKFAEVGSTMMMCADMASESLILKTLPKVTDYEIKNGQLYLVDKDNKAVLVLKEKK